MATIREVIEIDATRAEASLRGLAAEADAATKAQQGAAAAAGRVEASGRASGAGAAQAAKGYEELADRAGAVDSRFQAVAGLLDNVNPGLAGMLRIVGDVGGALEALALSGGAVLGVLGPLIAVVAAGALAYEHYASKAAEAADEQARLREEQEKFADAQRALSARVEVAQLRADVASGAAPQAALDLAQANADAQAAVAPLLTEASQRVAELRASLSEAEAARTDRSGDLEAEEAAVRKLRKELQEAEQTVRNLNKQETDLASALFEGAQASGAATAATKDRTAARSEESKALDALTARLQSFEDMVAGVTPAERQLLDLQRDLNAAIASGTGDVDRYVAALAQVEERLKKLHELAGVEVNAGLSADQAAALNAALSGQAERDAAAFAGVGPTRADQEARNLGQYSALASGLGAATSGDLLSMVSLLGPQGAAIGAGLGGLQTLGQEGAGAIGAQLDEQFALLLAGVEQLPQLLGDVLPQALAEGVPALAEALIAAAPEIAIASIKAQLEALRTIYVDLPQAVGEGVYNALKQLFEELRDFLRNPLEGIGGNGAAQNTLVDIGRAAAGVLTLGASEIAYGAANAATGGGVRQALYAGDRENGRRSRQTAGPDRTPGREAIQRQGVVQSYEGLALGVAGLLKGTDTRYNLQDAPSGARYAPYGTTGI